MRHIPEYAANANAKLCGFFDVNLQRAQELADQYGTKAYGSYQELLADPQIEAVSVLTPNFTHAEITIAALKAGKHVLCEKPMAVTLQDCEAMVQTAEQTGKKLMIGQNQRLTPAHQKARELLCSGAIGDVITFRTSFSHSGADNWSVDGRNSWFMDKNRSHFGAMADLGVHKTDLMIYLLGQRVVKASAVLGTLQKKYPDGTPITVDDNAFCTFVMENNGETSISPPSFANTGEKIIQVATPRRANAISEPIANAISFPLNHFTIPRETVIPAISTPQPKIMKPIAANLAEAGMPS